MTDTAAKNPAEVAFHSLRRVAKATGRNTQELLVLYTIERFLAALAKSSYRARGLLHDRVTGWVWPPG